MNSVKMAFRLLKNNFKIYELYLIVIIVSVATYYNFVAIQYNDKFQELAERLQSATLVSGLCGFVLIITVIFFMWHANGFFLKQREKETGLYMLMGISAAKIGKIFAIESIFLGTFAFAIGLPIGILFSKLFFMLLSKSITLDVQLPFQVSPKSIIQVMIVFILIFVLLGFRNYNIVKKSQLINMINATKRKSTAPKLNYGKGILGVVLIIVGYIIGLNVKKWEIDLMVATMSTLILVCLGTYMLFGSFLTIVFSNLIKCKRVIYKNVRLVTISNIFFRLKANYRSLAMTTILAASTVAALGVSLSFKQYANDEVVMEAPYSLSYISDSKNVDDKVDKIISESGNELTGSNYLNFFLSKIQHTNKKKGTIETTEAIITSYSEVKKNLDFLNFRDKKRILKEIEPNENEATFILNARTMASPVSTKGDSIEIFNNKYHIKSDIKVPFTGRISDLGNKNIYVLQDNEYEKVKGGFDEVNLRGIKLKKESNDELIDKIKKIIPNGNETVFRAVSEYIWEYYALGIFFFLGLIMSIVFMLATFSALYFKTLSDALLDRNQYSILKKIGMSKKDIVKAVYTQVGIVFLLPSVLGIIHSVIAMKVLEEIMNVQFLIQTLSGMGIFIVGMMFFYVIISVNYTKIVYGR